MLMQNILDVHLSMQRDSFDITSFIAAHIWAAFLFPIPPLPLEKSLVGGVYTN